jgi:hypothetical protein
MAHQEAMSFVVEVHYKDRTAQVMRHNCDTMGHAWTTFQRYKEDQRVRMVRLWCLLTCTHNLKHETSRVYHGNTSAQASGSAR